VTTEENLKTAFAGESQANRRYLAFAKKAEEDGFKQVARLFRAVAEAETVHAHSHFKVMKGVKSTADNLEVAIKGETYEFTEMYPEMMKKAQEEKQQDALASFSRANNIEKIHAQLYQKALESVKAGKDMEEKIMHVCPVCGHTVEGEAPEHCPYCGAAKDSFMKIE
jgi:rubrerythrin